MDQRCHTFPFGHYHQAPGTSCGTVLSLSCLLSFLCNPYIPFLNFSFTCIIYIRKYDSTFYTGIAMVILPYFGPMGNEISFSLLISTQLDFYQHQSGEHVDS